MLLQFLSIRVCFGGNVFRAVRVGLLYGVCNLLSGFFRFLKVFDGARQRLRNLVLLVDDLLTSNRHRAVRNSDYQLARLY